MTKTKNVLDLVKVLRWRKMTLNQVAIHCQVDYRTARRYIATLRESGLSVRVERRRFNRPALYYVQ